MNQILVTEKLYITPELKRKKKFYRMEFFISVFLVCILFSYYIYAEYDKAKGEETSKEILASTTIQKVEDDTTIKDDLLVVLLDEEDDETPPEQQTEEVQEIGIESSTATGQEQQPEEMVSASGTRYTRVAEINIPKIGVNYSILSVTTDELLKISPCRFWGAYRDQGVYDANKVGNFCIVGHNYRNKRFFSKVPELENGDIIELTDATGKTIKYIVYSKYIVDPDDNSCTSQYTNGKREVTLITCTNDSKQRYVIKATEVL